MVKTFTIEGVPDELWEKFKSKTTKDITINDKIISLIKEYANG